LQSGSPQKSHLARSLIHNISKSIYLTDVPIY
jgi:hypothetical protein